MLITFYETIIRKCVDRKWTFCLALEDIHIDFQLGQIYSYLDYREADLFNPAVHNGFNPNTWHFLQCLPQIWRKRVRIFMTIKVELHACPKFLEFHMNMYIRYLLFNHGSKMMLLKPILYWACLLFSFRVNRFFPLADLFAFKVENSIQVLTSAPKWLLSIRMIEAPFS